MAATERYRLIVQAEEGGNRELGVIEGEPSKEVLLRLIEGARVTLPFDRARIVLEREGAGNVRSSCFLSRFHDTSGRLGDVANELLSGIRVYRGRVEAVVQGQDQDPAEAKRGLLYSLSDFFGNWEVQQGNRVDLRLARRIDEVFPTSLEQFPTFGFSIHPYPAGHHDINTPGDVLRVLATALVHIVRHGRRVHDIHKLFEALERVDGELAATVREGFERAVSIAHEPGTRIVERRPEW